jgi:hypothetical protein
VTQEDPEAAAGAGMSKGSRVRASRGWASLYAAAFVLLLLSGAALAVAVRGLLQSNGFLWLSIWFSGAAIVLSMVSVILPRRG